jgi:5-methyltetrahydropteroyltriglutamate--homocysteine methyltransferase
MQARAALREGSLDEASYRAIEDDAVDKALRIQEEAGVDVATDGEMRRDLFCDQFVSAVSGVTPHEGYVVKFLDKSGDVAMEIPMPFVATEKIEAFRSPGLEEFIAARSRTTLPLKVTLPSPTMVSFHWTRNGSGDAYPDVMDLIADAAVIVRKWVSDLAEAGCEYIQLDSPEMAELHADSAIRKEYEERGISVDRYLAEGAELINEVTNIDLPAATTLGIHVCKGNGTQSWIASGGYEDLCKNLFRRAGGFDVYHMEFDDERSGSFEPLRHLPDEKIASLGLVSTKWRTMEDPDVIRRRVGEASRFHPLENLSIATQCGFASAAETADVRLITEQTQFDKLRLVADTARKLWG